MQVQQIGILSTPRPKENHEYEHKKRPPLMKREKNKTRGLLIRMFVMLFHPTRH